MFVCRGGETEGCWDNSPEQLELLSGPPDGLERGGAPLFTGWEGWLPKCQFLVSGSPSPNGPRQAAVLQPGFHGKPPLREGTPLLPSADLVGALYAPLHWPPGGTEEPTQLLWFLSTLLSMEEHHLNP